MRPFNVVFTEVVEHVVRVHEDSANRAVFKAVDRVIGEGKPWEFSRVEAEDSHGFVDEVIV